MRRLESIARLVFRFGSLPANQECLSRVVFALPLNILARRRHSFLGESEGPIRALLFKEFTWCDFMRDQVRRSPLDFFDQGGDGYCGVQANKQVQVILDAAEL